MLVTAGLEKEGSGLCAMQLETLLCGCLSELCIIAELCLLLTVSVMNVPLSQLSLSSPQAALPSRCSRAQPTLFDTNRMVPVVLLLAPDVTFASESAKFYSF